MLTLQIIFESLLAILLIVSSVATIRAGRSLAQLKQERDLAFHVLTVLQCAIRTAQNEAAALKCASNDSASGLPLDASGYNSGDPLIGRQEDISGVASTFAEGSVNRKSRSKASRQSP